MNKSQSFAGFLNPVPRGVVWASQLGVFAASGYAAFLLRFDFAVPARYLPHLLFALPVWIVSKTVVFHLGKQDRGVWRYFSVTDIERIAFWNAIGTILAGVVILIAGPAKFPRSIYLLDLMLSFLLTGGLRLTARLLVENHPRSDIGEQKNTAIYGAGDAGVTLLKEIRNNQRLSYRVLGFIDDGANRKGLSIGGLPILGSGSDVNVLVRKYRIELILIAIPSATGEEMTRILELCHSAAVECKTVPGLGDIIEGGGLAGQIRDVAVEDLLGRTPVRLEEEGIRATLQNKTVFVTGAAGSIGSELCRQIARFSPAGIIGFDSAESPLFEIDREMRESFPNIPFHAEIGSIQHRARLCELFGQHKPAVVYHAAAYKHVPLMETHVFEAIENNVFGTLNLAEIAKQFGVQILVMISSDKAVRPTNIMGASKRVAELILLSLQNGGTQFVAVRFGNVLGSNGSVIPIFKKQIASGGPVTVTHPEMRRFFMTIPEACQLVLQASAIGEGGQICVLDMGSPVKIVDLARKLILLSGLKPDEEIKIQFTGTRPGEKLYEELSSLLEDTIPTKHDKVRIFVGSGLPENDMSGWLESLRSICETRDIGRLVVALKEAVHDYNPSTELLKRIIKINDGAANAVQNDREDVAIELLK
jgi:FlaA1/EpsC-like NDP-sugar epimerase